jgi:hypothetical protein
MSKARDLASSKLPATTSIGAVTSTHLQFVSGLSSAVQTQLNSRPVPGSTGIPFIMASGNSSLSGANGPVSGWYFSNAITVVFPVGRFTVSPPIITLAAVSSGGISAANVSDQSNTGFTFYVSRLAAIPSGTLNWTAVQMTSGAAGG